MAERVISPRTYIIICIILVLLTLLTTSISFLPLPTIGHFALGLLIGITKASLVVLFFMHALVSDRVTRIVIAVSCFWLGILVILTLTDYVSRNLTPFMPGH